MKFASSEFVLFVHNIDDCSPTCESNDNGMQCRLHQNNTTNRSAQITINKSESINTQDMSLLGLFKITLCSDYDSQQKLELSTYIRKILQFPGNASLQ